MKKLTSILLSLSILLVLSACGGENQASNNTSAQQSSEDTIGSSSDQTQSSDTSSANSSKKTSSKIASKSSSVASPKTASSIKINYGLRRTMIRKGILSFFSIEGRGYYDLTGAGITLDWSGASIEFNVNCEKDLSIALNSNKTNEAAYVTILVDGKEIDGGRTSVTGSTSLVIAKNLTRGPHKVKVIRQSDCEGPLITLSSITTNGQLVDPPAKKDLFIEYIGDSNQIGWGNLLDDDFYKTNDVRRSEWQKIARADENQDGTKTYPVMASNALKADLTIISKQGAGVAVTYHTSPASGCMNQFYLYSSFRYGAPQYTFERKADYIVLDIGAADLSNPLITKAGFTASEVKQKNIDFLKNIVREKNPTAKIIWTYGLTNSTPQLETFVKEVIEAAGGSKAGFYSLKLPSATESRIGYPSISDHQKAATTLTNYIRNLMK